MAHHFAHYGSTSCHEPPELAILRAAAEAVGSAGSIRLPSVSLEFESYKDRWTISPAVEVPVSAVEVTSLFETAEQGLALTVRGKTLFVHLRFQGEVGCPFWQHAHGFDSSLLDVAVEPVAAEPTIARISQVLVHDVDSKTWVFNSRAARAFRQVTRTASRLRHVKRGLAVHVDGCPRSVRSWHGKPYANVLDDCTHCQSCVSVGFVSGKDEVLCLGTTAFPTFDSWKAREGMPPDTR